MNESTLPAEEAEPRSKGFLVRIAEAWQWIVALMVVLFALSLRTSWRELQAPDAPVVLFWSTILIGLLIAAAHTPPVFFRLSRGVKVVAYVSIAAYFVFFISTFGAVRSAWEKTPQGAAEAKQAEIDRQAAAKADAERQKLDAQIAASQRVQQRLAEEAAKLERCSPALQRSVRNSLHNPHDSSMSKRSRSTETIRAIMWP
jgi:hypothetical protein